MAKEICQDCERIFEPKSSKAMICPSCHRKRLSEAAKALNLNKLGKDAYSKQQATILGWPQQQAEGEAHE